MAAFVAGYYQEPVGMAAALAVPPLTSGRARAERTGCAIARRDEAFAACSTRSSAPRRRRSRPRAGAFAPFLLHGVTGSGKTDVYLDAASASDRAQAARC